jgi:large subunit ribosomal protein L22
MGARKRISAEARKNALKSVSFAKLRNVPSSPRKMRLVVDMIRGMEVFRALGVLKYSNKEAAAKVEKLLRSAIANWEQKNERKAGSGELYVTSVNVDCSTTMKRMRPAPQGRGYRIRKRSNHVTLFVDTKDVANENENEDNDIEIYNESQN